MQESEDSFKIDTMRLYRRKKTGVWYVGLGRGKEKSLKTKDRSIADRIFRQLKREILMGRVISLSKGNTVTVKEFKKEYEEHREPRVAKSTLKADKLALAKLLDYVGNKPLQMITQKILDRFHTDLLNDGSKTTSVNVHIRHLKAAFSQAKAWGYVTQNPYRGIKQLEAEEHVPNYLDGDQFRRLFDAIDDPEFTVMTIWYLYTGCRRAELVRLKWDDVLNDVLIIRKTKGKRPKIVPIPKDLQEIIAAMERQKGEKVFRWEDPSTITHLFEEYRDAAGLSGFRLHDLRHTTASHLAIMGVSQKQIQEILGHAQLSTTDIYTHLAPEHLREAMDKLDFAGKLQAHGSGNVINIEDKRGK
ncbi:MAG: tyrosine-type recombinase/integrase [Syntrophorhabdales bacterium]